MPYLGSVEDLFLRVILPRPPAQIVQIFLVLLGRFGNMVQDN